MDIALTRVDLLQVSPTSSRNTLEFLPAGKRPKQAFTVGDDEGSITCLRVKKGECQTVFKTLGTKKPVLHVCLGGPKDNKTKIFASSGQEVVGLSRKGKEFFRFNTNLTENVDTMFVEDVFIWTAGEYIYNLFDNGKDVQYFMSSDRINDLTVDYISRPDEYDVLLGCQDRYVRVVVASSLLFDASIKGPVNAISSYGPRSFQAKGSAAQTPKQLIYGTENGLLGQLVLDSSTGSYAMQRGWILENEPKQGTINTIIDHDITKDDVKDLVVGRDDGHLQIYGFDMGPVPALQFETQLGESVRACKCGVAGTAGFDEVMVCTFSGRIISFTSEPLYEQQHEEDEAGRSKGKVQSEGRVKGIRKELDKLREKVRKSKEKLSKYSDELVPHEAAFNVNSKFVLDPASATYSVTVETPCPLAVVMLQSALDIDLVDTDNCNAIVSASKPDPEQGNRLLATYRCQESVKRLEMRVRTLEGQYGEMQALVCAKMTPMTALAVKFNIKPLSLHHRLHDLQDERLVNKITFTGGFNLRQMHEWVSFCLPEVPVRLQQGEGNEEANFTFMNAYLHSILKAKYKKGEATFESDCISTIAILKEVITKLATERKVRIHTSFKIEPETMTNFLKLISPKLEYQLSLSQKAELIGALKEIKMQENETSYLAPEYLDVINNAERIEKEFKDRPRALQTLFGIVTDLYVDMHKFQGHDVKNKIPVLMKLLQSYDYDQVIGFFNAPL